MPDSGISSGAAIALDYEFRRAYLSYIEELFYNPSLLVSTDRFTGIIKYLEPKENLEYEMVETDLP